jgi:hypothetical protein
VVERVGEAEYPKELLLRLDEPVPGIAHMFAMDTGGQVYASIRLYLYGDRAAAAAARDQPVWQKWVHELFPAASEASNPTCD